MRLSINLTDEHYATAKAYAREFDCSVSAAVNALLAKAMEPGTPHISKHPLTGLPTVPGRRVFTSEEVYELDLENE